VKSSFIKLILILLFLLIILSSSLAVNKVVTYSYSNSDINLVVYKISDKSKLAEHTSDVENKIEVTYPSDTPSEDFYTYHYKEGFLPFSKTSNSDILVSSSFFPIKQPSCTSEINSITTTDLKENQDFTITVELEDLEDIFPSLTMPEFIPEELKSYYQAEIQVKLFINNQEKETKTIQITPENNKVEFTQNLEAGDYTIKIQTTPTDNKCDSTEQEEKTITIAITSETQQECSQITPNCPPKAAEKCSTGHPRCSCDTLNGYLCKENEICLATNLTHEDQGTCCSEPCIPKLEECDKEGEIKICDPDENGCTMIKECKNQRWTSCEKLDPLCTSGVKCEDGTPAGQCSLESPGKLCMDGELITKVTLCPISEEECEPLWDCTDWSACYDGTKYCNEWIDQNSCNKGNPPSNIQSCDYETPFQKFQIDQGISSGYSQTIPEEKGPESSVEGIVNKFMGIPRSFNVKVGLELPLALFIIAVIIASFLLYGFAHKESFVKKEQKNKPKKQKPKTKPVKMNDLLLSVVDSLKGDEKKIIDKLVEAEGLTPEDLKKKTGLTKTKLDIALDKLERRQILKKRKNYDDGVYINDWLK